MGIEKYFFNKKAALISKILLENCHPNNPKSAFFNAEFGLN